MTRPQGVSCINLFEEVKISAKEVSGLVEPHLVTSRDGRLVHLPHVGRYKLSLQMECGPIQTQPANGVQR